MRAPPGGELREEGRLWTSCSSLNPPRSSAPRTRARASGPPAASAPSRAACPWGPAGTSYSACVHPVSLSPLRPCPPAPFAVRLAATRPSARTSPCATSASARSETTGRSPRAFGPCARARAAQPARLCLQLPLPALPPAEGLPSRDRRRRRPSSSGRRARRLRSTASPRCSRSSSSSPAVRQPSPLPAPSSATPSSSRWRLTTRCPSSRRPRPPPRSRSPRPSRRRATFPTR